MKKSIFLLLIITALFPLFLYNSFVQRKKHIPTIRQKTYKIGDILINYEKREISFPASVQKNSGWVQFLIYLEGYKWLKKKCAIVSQANLQHLQNAIALFDWKMWDDIWYRTKKREFNIFIKYKNREIPAYSLILSDEHLYPEDIIFFGSPYFDEAVFGNTKITDCRRCPIYQVEKRTLERLFKRKTGRSGYTLNKDAFPPLRSKVIVIIRLDRDVS